MTQIETELALSYYREIALLDKRHQVFLVQHIETGKIFVKKALSVYDLRVYEYLKRHPLEGVPRIEELLEQDGRLLVIEEYISGSSLREVLARQGPLPEQLAVQYLAQVCRILCPLHALNPAIVHRDIKPSNLIVSSGGSLFLVDFNSAKAANSQTGRDTVLIGTAGYAAPEQYGFSASQPTADIYAMGVLLNEMLTGQLPTQKRYQGPLAGVLEKCLRMDPARRYQTAGELLKVLLRRFAGPQSQQGVPKAQSHPLLPPGLRSADPLTRLAGGFWYGFLVLLCLYLETDSTAPNALFVYRLGTFVLLFGLTLWLGNYQNLWQFFPLSRSPKRLVRVFGVTVWAFVFCFAVLFLFALFI